MTAGTPSRQNARVSATALPTPRAVAQPSLRRAAVLVSAAGAVLAAAGAVLVQVAS